MYSSPLAIYSCLYAAIASKRPVSRIDIRVSYGNNCFGFSPLLIVTSDSIILIKVLASLDTIV
jgi:hypothetical protein